MKNIKKLLSLVLVLALLVPNMVFANDLNQSSDELEIQDSELTQEEKLELEEIRQLINGFSERKKIDTSKVDFEGKQVRIIVELEEKPVIFYATDMGISYSQMTQDRIEAIEDRIVDKQQLVKSEIKNRNIGLKVEKNFSTVFNGFSGEAKYEDIEKIERVPGVKKVYISQEYERPSIKPDMNSSNEMVRSLDTWELGYKGEGMVVAIIDTGIDPTHKDMVLSEGTTPKLTNASLEGKGLPGKYYTDKVPYGYNYYDLNDEILDIGPDASEHGMHVAGTVGANGDVENGGIKGVAPECQLLAMKVFSNDPVYATTFDDIYLAAIEDAIKLGANVLNMSLGSTASFYIPESAVDKAISNAVANGIVCSISAGNSAQMTDGWPGNYGLPFKENPDIGLVGAPGLSYDSIQVASIENTHVMAPYMEYKDSSENLQRIVMSLAGNVHPADVFSDFVEFVDCGIGEPKDFEGKDIKGKVALIIRGGLTFTEKIMNAQNAGAAGVIVYNHESGGDELINMAYPPEGKIPAVFIGYTGGEKLLGLENKLVKFSKNVTQSPNPAAGEMSDFTSWGTTPSLDLKPEITAPGGQIYSTLQNNKYGTMSGTSMAAPHVSGGSALVSQYIKNGSAFKYVPLNEFLKESSENINIPVLPTSTVVVENKAFSVALLEGEGKATIDAQKAIVNARKDNKDVLVKLSTGRIAELSGILINDYSKLSKTVTYVDDSGEETVYPLGETNSIEEQTKLAKILLMNTAKIVTVEDEEGEIIVSPRRQGAGMMNLQGAVTTPVIVVNRDNNEAKVELKDFENTSFTMKLRAINTSDKEISYKVDVDVLTDYIYDDKFNKFNVLQSRNMTADIEVPETITVPANGAKDFDVIVDFKDDEGLYRNMFVEGFVKLTETTKTYCDLSVPYVGFYGKWDEPNILDGIPELGEEAYFDFEAYGLPNLRMVNAEGNFLGWPVAISPGTEDGEFFGTDTVMPLLSFLRNAEEVKCNILDEGKNLLRTVNTEKFVRKNYIDGGRGLAFSFNPARAWDGKVKGKVVEEGTYYYQIQSKIHYKDARWQTKEIPIIVDITPPEMKDVKYDEETHILSGNVKDALTGINIFQVLVNGKNVEANLEEEGNFSINLSDIAKDNDLMKIEVVALDAAYNMSYKKLEIGEEKNRPLIYLETPELFEIYNTKQVVFTGAVFDTTLTPVVKVNGEEANVWFEEEVVIPNPDNSDEALAKGPAYRFEIALEFKDGVQEVSVEAITTGDVSSSIVRRFYVDTTPPELKASVKSIDLENKKAVLEVTMKDMFPVLKLYAFDSEIFNIDEMDTNLNLQPVEKTVDIEIDIEEGISKIPLTLVDIAGNRTECEVELKIVANTEEEAKVQEIEKLIEELPDEVNNENLQEVKEKLNIIDNKIAELLEINEDFDAATIEGYDKFTSLVESVGELEFTDKN